MNQSKDKEERLRVVLGIPWCDWVDEYECQQELYREDGFWNLIEAMRKRGFTISMGSRVGFNVGEPYEYWARFDNYNESPLSDSIGTTGRYGNTLPGAVFEAACTVLGIFDVPQEEPCQKSEQNEQNEQN